MEKPPGKFLLVIAEEVARIGVKQIYLDHFPGASIEARAELSESVFRTKVAFWDVILLDLHLPGRSGFAALKDLSRQFPAATLLGLVKETTSDRGLRALNEGAGGCLSIDSPAREFVEAVHSVGQGKPYVTARLNERLIDFLTHGDDGPSHPRLSNREFELLEYISDGRVPKEIAGELGLSAKTVSTVHTRLRKKLGVRTDVDILRYALRNGLVQH